MKPIAPTTQPVNEYFQHLESVLTGLDERLRMVEDFQVARGATIKADDKALILAAKDQGCLDQSLETRMDVFEAFMNKAIPWLSGIKWLTAAMVIQFLAFISAIIVLIVSRVLH